MVNGRLSDTMPTRRGIRQGDPLSPYVFIMVMEYLSRCLDTLRDLLNFNYHSKCQDLGITHLCFADDLLLFARGDIMHIQWMRNNFHLFPAASGLRVNLSKIQVYFGGVNDTTKVDVLHILGYELGQIPFKYSSFGYHYMGRLKPRIDC